MNLTGKRNQIGTMRQVVRMLKNVPTDSGAGAIDHYGVIVTTRGLLRKQSGNRALSFAEIINSEGYEIWLRQEADITNNLRVDNKFLIDGLVYSMDSWELVNEVKFYYRIKVNIHKSGTVKVVAPQPIDADTGVLAVWLTTTIGAASVSSGVEREGTGYTPSGNPPGNKEFYHSGSTITFLNSFASGEIIYVLYK